MGYHAKTLSLIFSVFPGQLCVCILQTITFIVSILLYHVVKKQIAQNIKDHICKNSFLIIIQNFFRSFSFSYIPLHIQLSCRSYLFHCSFVLVQLCLSYQTAKFLSNNVNLCNLDLFTSTPDAVAFLHIIDVPTDVLSSSLILG